MFGYAQLTDVTSQEHRNVTKNLAQKPTMTNHKKKTKLPHSATKVRGVYFRKDRGVYWFKKTVNFKSVYVDLETTNYVEAIARAAAIQNAPCVRAETTGWRAEIDNYLAEKKRLNLFSENTARNKRLFLDTFAGLHEKHAPHQIKKSDAEAFYNRLLSEPLPRNSKCPSRRATPMKPITANSYVAVLQGFWTWLISKGTTHQNPWAELELRKVDSYAKISFVNFEDFQKLIAEAPNDDIRFILYCGFHAGLRRDEIVNAKPAWFDKKSRLVRVISEDRETTPTGFRQKDREALRTIPMTLDFAQFLEHYPSDGPYMLRPDVEKGAWRYRYDFRRPYTEYMISKGFEWATPHVMRHSFASHLVFSGASLFKVAQYLGDGIRVVEKHYAHLRVDDRAIDDHFPATLPQQPSQAAA